MQKFIIGQSMESKYMGMLSPKWDTYITPSKDQRMFQKKKKKM